MATQHVWTGSVKQIALATNLKASNRGSTRCGWYVGETDTAGSSDTAMLW